MFGGALDGGFAYMLLHVRVISGNFMIHTGVKFKSHSKANWNTHTPEKAQEKTSE